MKAVCQVRRLAQTSSHPRSNNSHPQIIALSSLINLAVAAQEPMGYITTYELPDCAEVGGDGGVGGKVDTYIRLNECENLSLFVSFQGGMGVACNPGKTPKVTAYTQPNCEGTAVDAGTIPADYFDGPCQEILDGQSASFACV